MTCSLLYRRERRNESQGVSFGKKKGKIETKKGKGKQKTKKIKGKKERNKDQKDGIAKHRWGKYREKKERKTKKLKEGQIVCTA